ncbi:SRPBCC domain-containing protein [Fulvivirga sp. RKSG066]|uniref:SRPBCC domain-containing protein n=1 Tax=Fulvivirga aurantia TaxID=2529383 RepID=UPI0012BC44CE|nr:SRPBCC domain-containing protein [Fulvivirga aurantia]MTI22620.1 SRPBCC domain-containing protein [Fulvivirga aurantia]
MREIQTEIKINKPKAEVWKILMDFDKYPEWNPFILSLLGKPKLRSRLKVTIRPEDGKPMVFKPKVTMHKSNEVFAWLGQLWMTGLFDGHHRFELKAINDSETLFVHREEFSGLLVPLFWKQINTKTRAGFEAMNKQLKVRAEA